MRKWSIVEQGKDDKPVHTIMTDSEILAVYFDWWSTQMRKVNKHEQITAENCIQDWVVVHWGFEIKDS